MKKSLLSFSSLLAVAVVLGSHAAQAQSMDYGSLQDLFGEPVTTAATGTPQKASEVATNMTIITADEIRQSGSRNIPEILARVPGLDVLRSGINGYDVGVRGYSQGFQPRLLVLLDGRQVFLDDYSRTLWDNIPVNIDDIRQIEVVKGASSALFGSNAAGGVINIVTYSPKYDNNNVASVSLGTQNALTGDATVTQKYDDKISTKASAGGLNENQTGDFGASAPYSVNPYHRYVTNTSVLQPASNFEVTLNGSYDDTKLNDVDFLNDAVGAEHTTTYSFGVSESWQTAYGLLKNNNYINHTYDAFDNPDSTVGAGTTLVVSNLEDQFKIGADNTFRVGAEYRYKEAKATTLQDIDLPNNNHDVENVYAVNGTWLWNITDKLSWTNAAREDHSVGYQAGQLGPNSYYNYGSYNQAQDAFTANSGLVYKATDLDSFRLTYGRGAQFPSFVQTGYNAAFPNPYLGLGPTGVLNLASNPDLKPTIVTNYETGYDRKVDAIDSVAKFSVFYQTEKDITAGITPGTVQIFGGRPYLLNIEENVGGSKAYGGEFELQGSNPSGFRWDGSYSFSRVTDSGAVAEANNYQGSTPQHHLRGDVGYTTGPWEFDANGEYQSSRDLGSSTTPVYFNAYTSGYMTFGGRIGYKVNDHVTVAASGVNINRGETNEDAALPPVERQGLLTITDKF